VSRAALGELADFQRAQRQWIEEALMVKALINEDGSEDGSMAR